MPELPEVETTLRGIKPHIIHQEIVTVIVRQPRLRWPIPTDLKQQLEGQTLQKLTRRGKYLLFTFPTGTLILHLGMSGSLRVLAQAMPPQKHDHVDIGFANQIYLRFTDPRRFGALLFTRENPHSHSLLMHIGPEPLSQFFSGDYLWEQASGKKLPVKTFIMDGKILAGVGNIYATEALFQARLHPHKSAGKVTREQYQKLAQAIKTILQKAIKKGGTTLKDFQHSTGKPGYFRIELQAYGRHQKPCLRCQTYLKAIRIGQRTTVFCPLCQH
jgi:formamidopyrimidine-DNA glycosylase